MAFGEVDSVDAGAAPDNDGSGPTLAQILQPLGAPDGGLGEIASEILRQALRLGGVDEQRYWDHVSRLANPDLLLSAVPVGSDLAVPVVTGQRKAGSVRVSGKVAATVMGNLAGRNGFPNTRVVMDSWGASQVRLQWGDDDAPLPEWETSSDVDWACADVANGLMYGYSTAAIREYLSETWGPEVAAEAMRANTST